MKISLSFSGAVERELNLKLEGQVPDSDGSSMCLLVG